MLTKKSKRRAIDAAVRDTTELPSSLVEENVDVCKMKSHLEYGLSDTHPSNRRELYFAFYADKGFMWFSDSSSVWLGASSRCRLRYPLHLLMS